MPEIRDPLDTATKALTMRHLMQEGQLDQLKVNEAQRQYADQQTMRDAYKNNTTIDENGNPHFNQSGYLSEVTKNNPLLGQQETLKARQQKLDQLTQQHAAGKQIIFRPIGSQADLDYADELAKQFGLPPLKGGALPANFNDPSFPAALSKVQNDWLDAKDQLDQHNKQIDQTRQQQEADAKMLEARAKFYEQTGTDPGQAMRGAPGQSLGQPPLAGNKAAPNLIAQNGGALPQPGAPPPARLYSGNPPPKVQADAMKEYVNRTDGRALPPDVAKARTELQSVDKINEAIAQAPKGNLSNLSGNQLKMIFAEGAKLATGGAPTQTELDELTPQNFAQKSAAWWQKVSNKPVPSNAGEFIKQLQEYANGIGKTHMQTISDFHSEIADNLRPTLGESQYSNLKYKNDHRFDNSLTRKVLRLQELRAKKGDD